MGYRTHVDKLFIHGTAAPSFRERGPMSGVDTVLHEEGMPCDGEVGGHNYDSEGVGEGGGGRG